MSWIVKVKFEVDEVEDTKVLPELLKILNNFVLNGDNLVSFSMKENPKSKWRED